MYMKYLKEFYKKNLRLRKYNNVVEAAYWSKILRRCSGTSVYELDSLPGDRVVRNFTYVGLLFFIFFVSGYTYCTIVTYYYDQTIIRMLYNTKLRRYGDDFERCTSLIYALIIIIIIPFRVSGNDKLMQKIVDLDKSIEKAGDILDYNTVSRIGIKISCTLILTYVIRLVCIWYTLESSFPIPFEKMYQVVYSDTLALICASLYCYHLVILKQRYEWINKTLSEVKMQKSWEYKVYVRGNLAPKMVKVVELQEKQVSEKIKTCARVFGALFDCCDGINRLFGFALLLTALHYYNYLILYLFYFMEATATGLFHDTGRYIKFLVYTFWEIIISTGIIFFVVVYSEMTVREASKTSFIIHEIINEDLSPLVTQGAMQLSIQILHEMPVFHVLGYFRLNYSFLQQGVRSVFTYLVILLQFVTDNPTLT